MIKALEVHILEEADEIAASPRWNNPNAPGSGRILDIGERVNSPAAFVAFRSTEEGKYLLDAIDAYENALNDDWMPFQIVGLPLDNAKAFILAVAEELRRGDPVAAVKNLRERYAQLSNS